jgi:hypothetical protein
MKDSLIYCEQRYEHLLGGILLEKENTGKEKENDLDGAV